MSALKFAALAAGFGLIAGAASAETIKVGVTPGPHAAIMEKVAEEAAKEGLEIEIMEFSDYVVPNQALADGDLDANSFQHQPYLDNQVRDRGFDLVSVATTVNYPMGVYSEQLTSLDDLPEGGSIAIPNDPTNGGRALLLLESLGYIGVDDAAGLAASPLDVTENPKNIDFLELDAAQLPRSLQDVDATVINTNYAMEAGLKPGVDSIAQEPKDSPYVNVIAVRSDEQDAPWLPTLINAYHSDAVKQFIEEKYEGAVVTSW
ncbi:MetQ/NlpA family ABC transporter substrate-binding protein [Oceanicella sp. SM1341]|uniref:MetQ/NlpA family ABC transporter substrate-binding protein n=1 Tax=Oceanicella sp. SM1341 TaxID=1548889 RepID=UPI000E5083C7|nr:MetQ/NlpA family ABC transporter substrate-binding protein [Oceanicella sp. SM1341]